MTRSGVASAAVAGAVAISFFAAAWLIFVFSAAIGVVSPLYGDTQGEPGALNLFGMYVLAPAVAAFGAALPARALGAGWLLSVLAGAAVVGTFFWTAFAMESTALAAGVFALAPAVVTLVGLVGSGIEARSVSVLLGASVILLVVARLGIAPYPVLAAEESVQSSRSRKNPATAGRMTHPAASTGRRWIEETRGGDMDLAKKVFRRVHPTARFFKVPSKP
jgi:hypothetical protein